MSQAIIKEAYVELPDGADKRSIIQILTESLVAAGKIDSKDVADIVAVAMTREDRGSTGIGHGIAIPHCRSTHINSIMCSFGTSRKGLDFDSLDGEPVYSVFLLLTPEEAREDHLELMRNFATQIRKENFCEFLHQNADADSLIALLSEFEEM
jgi:PTS system fructose-specific IIA component/PTS system nitrogen regulatory IIA component